MFVPDGITSTCAGAATAKPSNSAGRAANMCFIPNLLAVVSASVRPTRSQKMSHLAVLMVCAGLVFLHEGTLMAQLYAGTSGFAYPSWKPDFYPAKLGQKGFLQHYATRLNAVEVNYTFRRLVSAGTLEGWVAQTPAEFHFCIKAHQRITHIQRLKPSEFTEVFFKSIDPLRSTGRLGAVLFQLPPNMKC